MMVVRNPLMTIGLLLDDLIFYLSLTKNKNWNAPLHMILKELPHKQEEIDSLLE